MDSQGKSYYVFNRVIVEGAYAWVDMHGWIVKAKAIMSSTEFFILAHISDDLYLVT